MKSNKNFLINQYISDKKLKITHNYLQKQFSDIESIIIEIRNLVDRGDFTLGIKVQEFEEKICKRTSAKFCVAVGSGTDAITLGLKACGIGYGDEVITTPYTFFGTIGGIKNSGAEPIFADICDDFNINPDEIRKKITNKTKAIVPVHWSGLICNMAEIKMIAQEYGLRIIEDACHCIDATLDGIHAGLFGDIGCFSLHPLKNLNVWGDGGYIITNDENLYDKLLLLRNHGQINRNEIEIIGHNSRLDSIQAIVAINIIENHLDKITKARRKNANNLNELLIEYENEGYLSLPRSPKNKMHVYHLYCLKVNNYRNEMLNFLIENGIDAKIHYPIPIHLQKPFQNKYKKGDMPVAELLSQRELSLPVHEFLSENDLNYIVDKIKVFFNSI